MSLHSKRYLIIVCVALCIVGIVGAGIIYRQRFHPQDGEKLSQTKSLNPETNSIVDRVSKLMDLPAEKPTLATVTDTAKVKDNPFLATSHVGDVLLLYKSIGKVILYRPSINKIIGVTSIKLDDSQASSSASIATNSAVTRVAILDGTQTQGLAAQNEKQIESIDSSISVVERGNTVGENYQTTLVVAIKKEYHDLAVKIAQSLHGKVSNLPKDEVLPKNADILIILGENAP